MDALPCRPISRRFKLAMALVGMLLFANHAQALTFGKNKLHTRGLDWRVLETAHFEIHYYPEEAALAAEVCEIAEEAYHQNSRLLRYKLTEKTPLFLYRNHGDFQQTNITPSVIGTGVGGFTEAYKNRIALPAPASPEMLRQVITHEFMHAMQFDILYGEGLRSFRVYKGYLIPEWMIEGLAEYAAQDWDSYAEMTVRDAVLHDRLVPLTLMDGFGHLEDVFLAYKQSQLAVMYLAEKYGEEKLATIFKSFRYQVSLSQILREVLGQGLAEFNEDFMAWVRGKYWVQAHGKSRPENYGPVLESSRPGRLTVITGPAWSPDGRWLAYVSNQDQTYRIYLKPRGAEGPAAAVTSHPFEAFATRGRVLAWSPDSSKIAFAATESGRNRLYLLEVASRTLAALDLEVPDFSSPAWSPDGEWLALAGVRNGVGDLFAYHLRTRAWRQLTHDRPPDETPAWSRDGSFLVYSTELKGHWQLARIGLEPGSQPQILTRGAFDHQAPVFDHDGRGVYFSGDPNGISNLCWLSLDPSLSGQRLTDLRCGAFQPALSPDGRQLAYTSYKAGSWQLNAYALESLGNTLAAVRLPLPEEPGEPAVEAVGDTTNGTNRRATPVSDRPYAFRFSPDLLFLLAGYDSTQGVIGGGYLTASDYLGDHQISLITDIVPGYHAQTQLTYWNSSAPVAVGMAATYLRNYYRVIDLETRTPLNEFNDEEIGGALLFRRPFSLYDRLETELGVQTLRRETRDAVYHRRVSTVRLSLVHDDTRWYDYEPANGLRHHLALIWADRILGGEQHYVLGQLDLQYYQTLDFVNPFLVLGARCMAAASLGENHPLFLFGGAGTLPASATLRGYPYGGLLGSQAVVFNLELRFPLARHINFSLWPLDFLMLKDIQCVVFNDAGVVTNHLAESTLENLKNAVGIGLRLHTFLLGKELLTLRVEFSKKTDGSQESITTWGIGQAF